jgi:hypothetical protein
MAIGNPVLGSVPSEVLTTDAFGNLAQTSILPNVYPVFAKALSSNLTIADGYFAVWADMRLGSYTLTVDADGLLVVVG